MTPSAAPATPATPTPATPVVIGLDAEFGLRNSTSAQAIERGIRIAIAEINAAGGVLGGRPLELRTKDNRSVTARGIRNVKEFAAVEELVAVFVGRFSPVALEYIDLVHDLKLILLDPWAAADGITDNGHVPNYAFRLSLKDGLAMPAMLEHAVAIGVDKVGLLLPNTSWGRSNLAATNAYYLRTGAPRSVATEWYNWGASTMIEPYRRLRSAGAEAIVFVANDTEAVILCRELAALPADQRVPIISHWGVTGGNFVSHLGDALEKVDYTVVQTFSFFTAEPKKVAQVLTVAEQLFGVSKIEDFESPVGVGHAYDLTHILARAIEIAGTADRAAVRDALEQVEDYHGLVRYFARPFTVERHDALDGSDVFMARYRGDGALVPIHRASSKSEE